MNRNCSKTKVKVDIIKLFLFFCTIKQKKRVQIFVLEVRWLNDVAIWDKWYLILQLETAHIWEIIVLTKSIQTRWFGPKFLDMIWLLHINFCHFTKVNVRKHKKGRLFLDHDNKIWRPQDMILLDCLSSGNLNSSGRSVFQKM